MALIKCKNCGKEVSDTVGTVCPNCGTKVEESPEAKELRGKAEDKKILKIFALGMLVSSVLFLLIY